MFLKRACLTILPDETESPRCGYGRSEIISALFSVVGGGAESRSRGTNPKTQNPNPKQIREPMAKPAKLRAREWRQRNAFADKAIPLPMTRGSAIPSGTADFADAHRANYFEPLWFTAEAGRAQRFCDRRCLYCNPSEWSRAARNFWTSTGFGRGMIGRGMQPDGWGRESIGNRLISKTAGSRSAQRLILNARRRWRCPVHQAAPTDWPGPIRLLWCHQLCRR